MQKLVLSLSVPQDFQAPVGYHLVSVHVRRGPGATLDHVFHKLVVQFAADDLVTSRDNRVLLFFSPCARLARGAVS